jgi:hypothetical protein
MFNETTEYEEFVSVFKFDERESNFIEFFLLEHNRIKNSPAHKWLKEEILDQRL